MWKISQFKWTAGTNMFRLRIEFTLKYWVLKGVLTEYNEAWKRWKKWGLCKTHDYLNVNQFRSNVACQSPHRYWSSQFNNWLRGGWLEDYQIRFLLKNYCLHLIQMGGWCDLYHQNMRQPVWGIQQKCFVMVLLKINLSAYGKNFVRTIDSGQLMDDLNLCLNWI